MDASQLISTAPSSGWAAARPRLGRAFRTAPVSRQTNPNRVWHSSRFHSRPATLLRPPFCPFHRSALFLPAAAQVKKETSRKRQKGKKHEIRRSQPQNQRSRGLSGAVAGVRAECSAYAVSRSDGEVSQLQFRQHHAHREAEARCHPRRRVPHLDFAWPLRPTWRKRHFHS